MPSPPLRSRACDGISTCLLPLTDQTTPVHAGFRSSIALCWMLDTVDTCCVMGVLFQLQFRFQFLPLSYLLPLCLNSFDMRQRCIVPASLFCWPLCF